MLWDSGEIVRWCCSAPGDARRRSNFLHVTFLSGETPKMPTTHPPPSPPPRLFHEFYLELKSAAIVKMTVNEVILLTGCAWRVFVGHPTLVSLNLTGKFDENWSQVQQVVSTMRVTFIDWRFFVCFVFLSAFFFFGDGLGDFCFNEDAKKRAG